MDASNPWKTCLSCDAFELSSKSSLPSICKILNSFFRSCFMLGHWKYRFSSSQSFRPQNLLQRFLELPDSTWRLYAVRVIRSSATYKMQTISEQKYHNGPVLHFMEELLLGNHTFSNVNPRLNCIFLSS